MDKEAIDRMSAQTYRPTATETFTASQVAQWLGGELREGEKAPAALKGLATLAEATGEDISFVAGAKALDAAGKSAAGLILTGEKCDLPGRARVVVDEVWPALAALMTRLHPEPAAPAGVHATAVIGEGVELGEGVSVGPYCVIGDGCKVGAGTVLGSHCILASGCTVGGGSRFVARVTLTGVVHVGQRVIIHPGAVLGADGFKFEMVGGQFVKIPQIGAVIIEDDVEIGANTTIDRAFLYETRVGRNTKLDNLVQIAHNVKVGPNCVLCAHVGVAGSTEIGAGCMLGGRAGLADNIKLGDGVIVGASTGVHSDWASGSAILGTPAMPMRQFWRVSAIQAKLPEYVKRLRALEKTVESLQANSDETQD